jgi:exosortase A
MNAPLAINRVEAPQAWRRTLPALGLLILAIVGLYYDSFRAMVVIWDRSETFAHCFLVLPISVWLIWRRRADLAQQTPRPCPWLLVAMGLAAFVWLLGKLVVVDAASQWFATTLLILAVPTVLGWRVAKVILFPLLYLYFAVPFGEFLMPQLMQSTADFTVAALRLSGIPVYREGLQFVIPSGNWSVVEACSGVRYLMASFMVGTLFAYLNYRSWRRRVAFGIVSLVVPVLANWLRAYMIVMLGHLSGNRLAVGVDHLIYGWVFFGVVITLVFMVGARWAEAPAEPVSSHDARAQAVGPADAWQAWGTAAAALLLLLLPPALLGQLTAAESARQPHLVAPVLQGGWVADDRTAAGQWRPEFKNPSVELLRRYHDGQGRQVGLFVGYYRGQGDARKLISSENVLVTSQDTEWNPVETGTVRPAAGAMAPLVRQTRLLPAGAAGRAGTGRLAWQLYWVDGRWMHRDTEAKLAGAWQRLRGQGDDSAVLVLYADDGSVPAAQVLEGFVRENLAMIEAGLKATRDGQ